jgi:2-iminobutanoate/2-iminopropanoate deaminase
MQLTVRNPKDGIYPASVDYVHALQVAGARRFLFISGTMGLDASRVRPTALRSSCG